MDRQLNINGVKKSYNGNVVLDINYVEVAFGHVYGLVGTNGAGKTTLLDIINGSVIQDEGSINNEALTVEMVHHDTSLFQELSICENFFVLREMKRSILGLEFLDWSKMRKEATKVLKQYGLKLDVSEKVKNLSISVQKLLEVVIALSKEPDIILIDEPLTFLDMEEVNKLNQMIEDYVSGERMAIYASHRLDELFRVVDMVITMRNGKIVSKQAANDHVLNGLLEFAEKDIYKYPKRPVHLWPGLLEVKNMQTRHLKGVDFQLASGEILGVVGLQSAYKSELGQALFGAIPFEGEVAIEGSGKRIKSTTNAVESGVCYIGSGDEGVFLDDSVMNNVISANVPRIRRLSRGAKHLVSKYYLDMLNITEEQIGNDMASMSAGMKQKVVLAKWFFSKSKIFIFNKPTSNIDIPSKVDIYNIFADLVESGAGIIIISNDLEEIAGLCDRVLVIDDGRIKATVKKEELSVHSLVEAMQNW